MRSPFYSTGPSESLIVTCLYVKQLGKDGQTKACDGRTMPERKALEKKRDMEKKDKGRWGKNQTAEH